MNRTDLDLLDNFRRYADKNREPMLAECLRDAVNEITTLRKLLAEKGQNNEENSNNNIDA